MTEIKRSEYNPLIVSGDIKPSRRDFEVIGVFNGGVVRIGDEVVVLMRVAERPVSPHPEMVLAGVYDDKKCRIVLKEFAKGDSRNDFSDPRLIVSAGQTYLTSMSHFRVARSKDGVNFEINEGISFGPESAYETFGIEDPRISFIEGKYYISYVGVSSFGVTSCLVRTEDFSSFERLGVIFCPDNKDVVIFPERIGGKFYALERPSSGFSGRDEIWLAESDDLRYWGNHRYLMSVRQGYWDGLRIGAGAVPVKTSKGWLEIYHGAERQDRYCLGAVLFDFQQPWKVLARSEKPLLKPETDYEKEGFFGEVVFTCGLLCEEGKLKIYYGAGDRSICSAEVLLQEVLADLGF